MDQAVREVAAGLGPKVALVALGGYGRAALCPGSDLDLMVLHARRRGIKTSAEAVFYPFWDAGFTVGHAVRTVRESVFAAREHLEAATALLDARLVWGDEDLFARMDAEVRATLRADAAGFLDRLRADARARGEAHGSAAHLLEPHLKESRGALRDVHAVGWALAGAGLEPEPDLLRPGEAAALADAEEFLVRLRSALHLESGRRRDRLVMEDQPGMARAFGYEATAGLDAPDALMRSLFEHARQVEHISASVLDRVERRLGGAPDVPPSPGPRGIVEVLTAAAGLDPIPAWLLDAAEAAAPPDPWTPAVRDAFLGLLASRPAALEALDRTGVLTALLPEWSAVRCRPQRDPYHRFTVDVHLLRTVEAAAAILDRGSEDPVLAAAAGAVHDRDAVLLGALLHDIGKRGQGDHVPVGVEVAGAVVERMGVGEPTAGHVRFLVGEHLLLADTATRRDLTDENPVVDVAARVETPERLAMLAVLTAADAASTGSHAWTPWRQALVRELVGKVQRVLDRGQMGPDHAAALEERAAEIRGRAGGGPEIEAFLGSVPRSYLLAVDPADAARHARLLWPRPGAAEVRTEAVAGPRGWTLTVVAADRAGLLARIAGALALSGLNILSAQVFTTTDGVAIDLFEVEPAFHGEVDEERWRRFRTDLRKALEGRLSLEARVREKRRHYPPPRVSVPVEVTADNEASDFSTVVEVSAPDRIGLLFDLARAFHELGLDVHVAKVATYGGRVIDAFYVRDGAGQKITDPERLQELRRGILAHVEDR